MVLSILSILTEQKASFVYDNDNISSKIMQDRHWEAGQELTNIIGKPFSVARHVSHDVKVRPKLFAPDRNLPGNSPSYSFYKEAVGIIVPVHLICNTKFLFDFSLLIGLMMAKTASLLLVVVVCGVAVSTVAGLMDGERAGRKARLMDQRDIEENGLNVGSFRRINVTGRFSGIDLQSKGKN